MNLGLITVAKDPAFLFYYQDFLVGSDHMTDEQVGQYTKCLCHQANRYTIRESHMKAICKNNDNFQIVREKFVMDSNGELYNVRLREEMEKRKNFTQSRINNLHSKSHMDSHMATRMEKKTVKKPRPVFIPPTLDEVKTYFAKRGTKINPVAFHAHYEANGWVQGKNKPVKSWQACLTTWEEREKEFVPGPPHIPAKKPAQLVVMELRILKWEDRLIKTHMLEKKYNEHDIDEALGKKF